MSDEEEEIYCICRSSDVSRFMIACDNCEEWYHGDCINVTEKEAGIIKKFFCQVCREKNPSLQIRYKVSKVLNSSEKHSKDKDRPKKDDKTKESKGSSSKSTDRSIEEKVQAKKDKSKIAKPKEHKKSFLQDSKDRESPASKDKSKCKSPKREYSKVAASPDNIKHKSKEKCLKDEIHKDKKLSKDKSYEKLDGTSDKKKVKDIHKESKSHIDGKVKKKDKPKGSSNTPSKESKSHKEKSLKTESKMAAKKSSNLEVTANGSSVKTPCHEVATPSAPVKEKPSAPLNISNSIPSSSGDFVRDTIQDVIKSDKTSGVFSSILEKTLSRPKQTTASALIAPTTQSKSSNKDSPQLSSTNNSSKTSNSLPSKTSGISSNSSKNAGKLSGRQLSVDLKDIMVPGIKCGTCDACRTPRDCGVCVTCVGGDKNQSCLARCCRNQVVTNSGIPLNRPVTTLEARASGDAHVLPPAPPVRLAAKLPRSDVLWQSSSDDDDERSRAVLKDRNERLSDDDAWEPARKIMEPPAAKTKNKIKKKKTTVAGGGGGGRKRKAEEVRGGSDDEDGGRRQCQGPGCVRAARPHSKYCSDECGLQLAQKRIFAILPQRIQEWKLGGCTAESQDIKKLERIRKDQLAAQNELQKLEHKCMELERVVERGLQLTVDPQADEEIEDEGTEGQGVYCVTCGHEVSTRRAIKHMENCFNKMESQTTFGSQFKTRIEGNTMFCDFYSPSTRTYCKRLRVMCPEHYKEPKVPETRVCGAPLLQDLFKESGELCRASRKKCIKHYRWERLRRAEIDMERVRQWMKLDELLEQERLVRQSMTNRAGVLGLMLHSTFDHPLASRFEQLKLQQQQQREQQMRQQQEQHFAQQIDQASKTENEAHDTLASPPVVQRLSTETMQPEGRQILQTIQVQKPQTITIPKFRLYGPQQPMHKIGNQSGSNPQVVRVQLQSPQQLNMVRPKPPTHVVVQQSNVLPEQQQMVNQQSLNQRPVLQVQYCKPLGQQQPSQPHAQSKVTLSDHRYFQNPAKVPQTPNTVTLVRRSDHIYYRPPASGAAHLKLKVTQHKTTTPPNQKKVIHLQKSASGSLYLQTPQSQTSARFGDQGVRPHQDHQYGVPPAPLYLRSPSPRPPLRSDHVYFSSKPPRPSK